MKDLEILQEDYDNALAEYCSKEGGTPENRRRVYELGQMISYLHSSQYTPSIAPEVEKTTPNHPRSYIDFRRLIIDELRDAEKYNNYYKQSGDSGYRTLSNQEKSHAQYFIDKATKLADADKVELNEFKKRYDRIK